MTALDYILDGLEAELALERELGIRSLEIDRTLLVQESGRVLGGDSALGTTRSTMLRDSMSPENRLRPGSTACPQAVYDIVFLHDRSLSPKGVEMMAKIVAAMGRTDETAPIVHVEPLPPAKAYVVLGGLALRKWFPGRNASPGMHFTTEHGKDVLVTYSPEYILRFTTITPAVKKIKQDMWLSLKDLMRRING